MELSTQSDDVIRLWLFPYHVIASYKLNSQSNGAMAAIVWFLRNIVRKFKFTIEFAGNKRIIEL